MSDAATWQCPDCSPYVCEVCAAKLAQVLTHIEAQKNAVDAKRDKDGRQRSALGRAACCARYAQSLLQLAAEIQEEREA